MSIESSDLRDELGSPSTDIISDALLTRIITDEETLYGSAARASDILYRHFSLEADKTAGRVSIDYSNRAELWKQISEQMKQKAIALQGTPIVGGISVSDKETVTDDSDYPDPFFSKNSWMEDDV